MAAKKKRGGSSWIQSATREMDRKARAERSGRPPRRRSRAARKKGRPHREACRLGANDGKYHRSVARTQNPRGAGRALVAANALDGASVSTS